MDFNSIKVRLEHYLEQRKGHLHGFQFHKGTIRTTEDMLTVMKAHPISIP